LNTHANFRCDICLRGGGQGQEAAPNRWDELTAGIQCSRGLRTSPRQGINKIRGGERSGAGGNGIKKKKTEVVKNKLKKVRDAEGRGVGAKGERTDRKVSEAGSEESLVFRRRRLLAQETGGALRERNVWGERSKKKAHVKERNFLQTAGELTSVRLVTHKKTFLTRTFGTWRGSGETGAIGKPARRKKREGKG